LQWKLLKGVVERNRYRSWNPASVAMVVTYTGAYSDTGVKLLFIEVMGEIETTY
jgi:hypothetical protein